jgi:hypothetical protein
MKDMKRCSELQWLGLLLMVLALELDGSCFYLSMLLAKPLPQRC